MTYKYWWQSKTVWIGLLEILGGVCTTLVMSLNGEASTEVTITGIIVAIIGIKNIILRAISDQPLK